MIKFANRFSTRTESGLMKIITSYDILYRTQAPMKFFPMNPSNLVDVLISPDAAELEVWHYTFNKENIVDFVKQKEDELSALIAEAFFHPENRRSMFTVDINTMKVLTSDDFKSGSPSDFSYNAFIFHTDAPIGFPNIYLQSRGMKNFKHLLAVQAYNSYCAIKPANKSTKFGKTLSFILSASVITGKFVGDAFPDLYSIDIPNSGSEDLPEYLDTEALDVFAEKCDLHKIKRVGETYVIEEDDPPKVTSLVKSEEKYPDEFNDKDVAIKIQRSVLDRGSIDLSLALGYGIKQTISAIPLQNDIIDVNLDIQGIFKKMCILEGKVYMVLSNPKDDWSFYLGNESEYFVECTDETFPKKYVM